MTDISSQTLHIVAKELNATLNDARASLEAYADRPDSRGLLEKCADQLHSAHGVLRVVEVYGAALLAEEMEHVTRYLLISGNDQKRQIDGLDALMRAMVQLPTYLERVLSGGRDLALILLPLLNDLRSVRGSPLLSEGTLLLLNLKSDQPAQPQAPRPGEQLSVVQWARRLRPRFQLGLLGYIRGERTVQNLEVLAKVAEKLEQIAITQPVFQLWWVVGAILEALRANGLEGSATLKRLLGQADRQIKLLYENGESRYCEDPPVDLLNNLLYYVARASTNTGRIAAVRASFKLSELLPVDDSIEQERQNLSAPSVKLMRTVAAAIKEDLSKVKDVLDIFVRRGGGASDELAPQLELLKKISDTLGVLGLGELRQRIQQEVGELAEIVTEGKTPSEEALVRVAGVLLAVEDSLDDQLVRLILPTAEVPGPNVAVEHDTEFRQVSEAVLRECIVNLARIKEAVTLAVQKPTDFSPQGLDNVPQLLRGIAAGLLMLGKHRAVDLMDAIGTEVRKLIEPGAPVPDALRLERVADAIVSIEYYMETLQNGRTDPWYMLDNAETCLKALADEGPPRVPDVALSSSEAAKTIKLDTQAAVTVLLDSTHRAHAATSPLITIPQPEAVDPQFVELFIEEAKEEITSIQTVFPLWDQNPMDLESLGSLRRSFHTLKGSGRMVGARSIAEFGWAIENLLNRIIDKTLSRTPGMMNLLRASVAALPQLVEQLESGRQTSAPVEPLMARAFAYADGREADLALATPKDRAGADAREAATSWAGPDSITATGTAFPTMLRKPMAPLDEPASTPTIVAVPEVPPPPKGPTMDPALHEIYSKETSSHLADIREYLRRRSGQPSPHVLSEAVFRAIHTLSGSSKMAEARHGIRVTEPLNHVMRKAYDNGQGLSDEGLATLSDAVSAIDNVVSHINESTGFFVDHASLLERLHRLESEIDEQIARQEAIETSSSAILPALVIDEPAPLEVSHSSLEETTVAETESAPQTMPVEPATAEHHAEPVPAERAVMPEPVAETPEPVAEPPVEVELAVAEFTHAEPVSQAVASADPPEPAVEFDHEIANIYSEEATELLEVAENSLNSWNLDHRDKSQFAELQRTLHTLKGGARMAGIAAMGDLSHELETLVIQIENGSVSGDERAGGVMQASLDELARMRDFVSAGQMPSKATALIGQIRALSFPEAVIPAEREVLPVAPAPAAPAAPGDAAPANAEAVHVAAPDAPPPPESRPEPELAAAAAQTAEQPAEIAEIPLLPVSASPVPETAAAEIAPAAETPAETQQPPRAVDMAAVQTAAATHSGETSTPKESVAALSVATPSVAMPEVSAQSEPTAPEEPEPAVSNESLAAAPEVSTIPVLPGREVLPVERAEMARVDADLLDTMLNNAGEVSIFRSRLDQQINSIDFNLAELARTVTRLKDQLRGLEIETEAQVMNRHQEDEPRRDDFDPLELDRYSTLQQFSRALTETSGDVASIQGLLETLTREAQNLLTQQSRVITELQNSLMRTRMVPFQRHVQRLTRLVRQAANDTGKKAELVVQGAAAELDRQMLERMVPPLEHMLRNAVIHGIEPPERRAALGKPEVGRISVTLERDGAEIVIVVADDGSGINVKLIREKANALGLTDTNAKLTDEQAMQLILEPGFSTAGHLTQAAGRGVGMDVVATEVKKLGGGLFIDSSLGKGSRFTIRLPFTLAISQALIVRVAEEVYALPLATVEGVVRLPRNIVMRQLIKDAPLFEYGNQKYKFQQLGAFVGLGATRLPETDVSMPVVLIRAGEHSTALVTDELVGSREIVVKSLGPQVSGIRGIAGATILGDGRIVIILDMGSLVRSEWRSRTAEPGVLDQRDRRTFALVVDDSITVRRVTQRLLERNGMRVLTAKDGVDAVSLLQENLPDIILLDIEMPRMDGYEVAAHVRNDARLKHIPIVMITSRVSEKHRARAIELGVDDYLGKPYQESQLLDAIEPLVNRRNAVAR
jgi:chemosensory pili system protein ChpA (sensor histidine kinase/response regulator)